MKPHWDAAYIGGYDDTGTLALTCVILTRGIFPVKMGYIPRGPVCDYTQHALLCGLMKYLHTYCRKHHISFIILDPDVPVRINGVPDKDGEAAAEAFTRCDVKRKKAAGFEQIQAGSVYRIRWQHGDATETRQKIYEGFDPKTRYNIRVAQHRGLAVEIYDRSTISEDAIQAFCDLMAQTGGRDHFVPRDGRYFLGLIENLHPNAKLFLVKYDPRRDLERTDDEIKRLTAQLKNESGAASAKHAQLEKQLDGLRSRRDRITAMLPEGSVYLSGSILAAWGEKSWYMYGASADICRDTMPNYLMQWAMIEHSIDLGCTMYDLRGVPAAPEPSNPLYGLYRFKKGFGGDLFEFPGEFFLVHNQLAYWVFSVAFARFKILRSSLMRLFDRKKRMPVSGRS